MRTFALGFAIALLIMPLSEPIAAQQAFQSAPRTFVTTLPLDPQQIPAAKPATINLKFRVASGMHVNSHHPAEDYLIPTTLALTVAPGVQWGAVDYPAGELRTFAFSSTEKLNVYTGDITLRVHLTARPGEHIVNAALRYQACDNRACYPPKTVPVQLVIVAK